MEQFSLAVGITFIIFIVVEVVLSARQDLDNYNKQDTLANFSIAIIGALLNLVFKGVAFAWFSYAKSLSPWAIPVNGWSLIFLFLATDLFYYLFHVLGHKSRFFWASHVIHHSSEKLNYTTALRSPVTNSWFRFFFSTPLPLVGFDPALVVLMDSIVLAYTFFIHTELVVKLGWLEKFMNTPSHHRVHHASNPKYIDKNYGAVLIIWDKLFGTFVEEEERPVYGITKPIETHNPIKIIFKEWVDMFRDLFRARTPKDFFRHLFYRPGWEKQPEDKMASEKNRQLKKIAWILVAFVTMFDVSSDHKASNLLEKIPSLVAQNHGVVVGQHIQYSERGFNNPTMRLN